MYLASYMMNKLMGFWPFLILRAWRNEPAFISIWNTWEKYLERNYDNIGLINLSTKKKPPAKSIKVKTPWISYGYFTYLRGLRQGLTSTAHVVTL